MAWKDVSAMSQREEFVVLASAEGANVSALCGRFGVSRKTGYKWLSRFAAEWLDAISADQSLSEPVRRRALQFAREWK